MSLSRPTVDPRTGGRHLPIFRSLAGYQRGWLRGDILAGLTVWAVLVPEALAYASIAGVSPVVGLYAAPAALLLYAAFGSSRQLIVGPMSATAALSAAIVADHAAPGTDAFVALTATLALAAGAIALVAGLLRLGFLANFISEPVLKGFIVGLALTIIAGQLPALFGVEGGSGDFFEKIAGLIPDLPDTSIPTLLVGVISLVIVVGLKRVAPILPGSLLAVGFGIGAVALFDLDARGVEIVGDIPAGLPPVGLPEATLADFTRLLGPAIGLVLVGFAEGLAAAKTYAAKTHDQIDPNRELIGVGASNVAAGLVHGMVVNGSLSKTAVNGGAGARSQLSGLVVAVLTILTLLFFTGLFETLPEATLAAVVIAAVIELVDIGSIRDLYRLGSSRLGRIYGAAARADFIAAVAALFGVLIFDTLPGLFIGIIVSILLLLYRASRPYVATLGRVPGTSEQFADVSRHAGNIQRPGIVILRPEGGLFFADADHVRGEIERAAETGGAHAVILDLESVPSVDVTAIRMLAELADDLEARGVRLVLAHDLGQVADLVTGSEAEERVAGIYPSIAAALEALEASDPGPPPDGR